LHKKGEANVALSNKSPQPLTKDQIEAETLANHENMKKDRVRMQKWFNWATATLFCCNLFLVLGFILLILAKLAA